MQSASGHMLGLCLIGFLVHHTETCRHDIYYVKRTEGPAHGFVDRSCQLGEPSGRDCICGVCMLGGMTCETALQPEAYMY